MSAKRPTVLSLREHEKLSYEDLSEEELRNLEKVTAELGVPMFRFSRKYVQAQQYVGMVQVGERTIQIVPKIYEHDGEDYANLGFLVLLLSYTKRLPLQEAGLTSYKDLGGSFLEVWIRYFAAELNRLLRRHLVYRYVEVEERTSFPRGKLLVERQLDGADKLYARYACRYDHFTPDHPLNQALKFCNSLLLKRTRIPDNHNLLQENDALLADVSRTIVQSQDLDRIHLDRLNRHYQPVLELCRLLLKNSTLNFRAGSITQLAFVFDMNRLFEEFVAEFLKRHVRKISLNGDRHLAKVSYQHRLGRLFNEFNMNADLVLTDDAEPERSLVLDTKYKLLDSAEKHAGLSQADFYQMYAYGSAGTRAYNNIVLLYPTTKTVVRRTFNQENRNLQLHVRQFDPRRIYDRESTALNAAGMIKQLEDALTDTWASA
jgi:5-methylcytosine-specific restriction enzyme subunit McrC